MKIRNVSNKLNITKSLKENLNYFNTFAYFYIKT